MIRYDVKDDQIKWVVLRKGKVIGEGLCGSFSNAAEVAEAFVLEHFKAEKIGTIVLMGWGERQLSLLKTTR
jgi:hypothetical protein